MHQNLHKGRSKSAKLQKNCDRIRQIGYQLCRNKKTTEKCIRNHEIASKVKQSSQNYQKFIVESATLPKNCAEVGEILKNVAEFG